MSPTLPSCNSSSRVADRPGYRSYRQAEVRRTAPLRTPHSALRTHLTVVTCFRRIQSTLLVRTGFFCGSSCQLEEFSSR